MPYLLTVKDQLCIGVKVNSYPTLSLSLLSGSPGQFGQVEVFAPGSNSVIASEILAGSTVVFLTGTTTKQLDSYPFNYWNYLVTPTDATLQLFLLLQVKSGTVQLVVSNTDVSLVNNTPVSYPSGFPGALYFVQDIAGSNPCQTVVSWSMSYFNSSSGYVSNAGIFYSYNPSQDYDDPVIQSIDISGVPPFTQSLVYYATPRPNRVFFSINPSAYAGVLTLSNVTTQQVDCL